MTTLEQLIKLRDKVPENPGMGICSNAFLTYNEMLLLREWPECNGDPGYPIDSPDFDTPCEAYHLTPEVDRWNPDHPYGAARLRLLDFLIAELEKEAA